MSFFNPWGPDRSPRLSYAEKMGIWLMMFLMFAFGVAVGSHF